MTFRRPAPFLRKRRDVRIQVGRIYFKTIAVRVLLSPLRRNDITLAALYANKVAQRA